MKKLLFLLAFVCFLLILPQPTLSQDFNYDRAYQDYIYNYDLYKKAYSEYELARYQYLQSGSLVSQEKAQEATAKMLQARDQVVMTHVTAIRLKMSETDGMDIQARETQYGLIDTEVAFYQEHKDKISSAATLEDLVNDSNEARARYGSTETVIYGSLALMSSGKVDKLQSRTNDLIGRVEGKVNEIRANGDKDTSDIERWILEVKNRVTRSQLKEDEAWVVIRSINAGDASNKKLEKFNFALLRFGESLQYLKEANNYLKQIVTEIKTQD